MKHPHNNPSSSVSKSFRKKLSSGVVKKFDKALALTSRVAKVSFNSKNNVSALSGATGSSIIYSNTGSKEGMKKDIPKIQKTTKIMVPKNRYTSMSTNESIISK